MIMEVMDTSGAIDVYEAPSEGVELDFFMDMNLGGALLIKEKIPPSESEQLVTLYAPGMWMSVKIIKGDGQ